MHWFDYYFCLKIKCGGLPGTCKRSKCGRVQRCKEGETKVRKKKRKKKNWWLNKTGSFDKGKRGVKKESCVLWHDLGNPHICDLDLSNDQCYSYFLRFYLGISSYFPTSYLGCITTMNKVLLIYVCMWF